MIDVPELTRKPSGVIGTIVRFIQAVRWCGYLVDTMESAHKREQGGPAEKVGVVD
jgi:hypothetical protein